MAQWSRRIAVDEFRLLGGEPTIHPDLAAFVPLVRKHWPKALIRIVTNGFFLHRHGDLPSMLAASGNADIALSVHHNGSEYLKRLQPVFDLLASWRRDHGTIANVWQSHENWTRRYNGSGAAMLPFEDGNPRQSWEICPARHCKQLHDGKLWKCGPLAYLGLQKAKYDLSEKWDPYLQYQPLDVNCSEQELDAFLAIEEESACSMCAAKSQPFSLPVPLRQATASGEADLDSVAVPDRVVLAAPVDSQRKADVLQNKQTISRHLDAPLVSIVVVNRDYAEYVGKTITSIRAQSYSHFECIVVDNASTDDSHAVIQASIGDDPRFSVVKLDENLGQLRAVLRVFDRLQGGFVVVVDADDMLLPEFLSLHLQVHLALPATLGFSSSDVLEIDANDRVLTGGRFGFADNCETDPRGLKPAEAAVRLSSVSDSDFARLHEGTIRIPYWKARWVWSPGTANMYRKAALEMALPDASRIHGHAGFDNYFCTILHLMTGTALITQRLSAYRLHGRNAFSSSPLMTAVQTQRPFANTRSSVQRLSVLHTLLSRSSEFNWILAGDRMWSTIDSLAAIENASPAAYFARQEVQDIVAETLRSTIGTFGPRTVLARLAERLDFRAIWRILSRAHGNRVPLALGWQYAREVLRRRHFAASGQQHLATEYAPEIAEGSRFPTTYRPGIEANAFANTSGIWIDGWSEKRCELTLSGGREGQLSIRGFVPNIARRFRSRLAVSVDGRNVGTLDLKPGEISGAWDIPPSEQPRVITFEFSDSQLLARPDTRAAAMLVREIAIRELTETA